MDNSSKSNIKLGAFLIAGTILLVSGFYFIGKSRNLFGKSVDVYATFNHVNGLMIGNNVRYAGIDKGTVTEIEILNDTTVLVQMSLDADLLKTVRTDSRVSIGTDGLMGNKLINIEPGSPDASLISKDSKLTGTPTVNTEEMLRTLEVTNLNVALISGNLRELTDNINRSRGTLYTVLRDTVLAGKFTRSLENIELVSLNLAVITNNFSGIADDIYEGKGLVGTLVRDTVMVADLQQALTNAKAGIEDIRVSAAELRKILEVTNRGTSPAGVILSDTAAAADLKSSLKHIDASAKSFEENMEALKHSIFLRGYYRKKARHEKLSIDKTIN